jgi:arginase
MQLCLIQVPYMVGDDRHGASRGPRALVDAAARRPAGVVEGPRVTRPGMFRDSASASAAVNRELSDAVRRSLDAGQVPLVVAGSCDVCLGILGAFDHACCGVVWIDAHADFNTPESTVSGFFAGMSLAVITGHCYRRLWARIGDGSPVAEERVLLVGVRDLSPDEERERLERSAILAVPWLDGAPQADVSAALDELEGRAREVYVHVDLDGLDPDVAPGIVDPPVPGGLSLADLEELVRGVADRFQIRAAALTTYDPGLDRDDRTLHAALRVVELLAEARSRGR